MFKIKMSKLTIEQARKFGLITRDEFELELELLEEEKRFEETELCNYVLTDR